MEICHSSHFLIQLFNLQCHKVTWQTDRQTDSTKTNVWGILQNNEINIYLSSTLEWSPLKRVKKLACVPVVPLTPRNRRSPLVRWRLRISITKSLAHKQALFPTVVNCAGLFGERGGGSDIVCVLRVRDTYWKCVKPSVGCNL